MLPVKDIEYVQFIIHDLMCDNFETLFALMSCRHKILSNICQPTAIRSCLLGVTCQVSIDLFSATLFILGHVIILSHRG